ncbi:hypothetical protein CMV04_12275 [Elizabethkingia anophelis]|nr:hypothetical protein [Elizabethkingia anophelis]
MRKPVRIGITGVIANATYTSELSPELEQLVTKIAEKAYYQITKPMETKYIKVPVNKNEMYNKYQRANIGNDIYEEGAYMSGFEDSERQFKEVPDHSEEMLSMLEEVKDFFQPHFFSEPLEGQEEFINQIEKLINKVKL